MTNSSDMTMPATHQYRADIDGLRALAILTVLGFHFFPQFVPGGFIGVDIFFVISGFLISSLILSDLQNNHFSLVNFYVRRINRIFPALIVILLFTMAAGWYVLIQDTYHQLNEHILWGSGFLYNILLLGDGGYFQPAAETRPLLHLWSLGIEEQFYIGWPLLLMVAWKLQKQKGVIFLLATLSTISFLINITAKNQIAAFYSPISRCWELLLGGWWAALTFSKAIETNHQQANIKSILGLGLIFVGLLLINKSRIFPGWWALLPVVGSFLIISAGANAWVNQHILSNKYLVWVGLISYPLYLWHWPLLTFARIYHGETLPAAAKILLIFLSFVLAQLTFNLIEKPIRTKTHRRYKAVVLLVLMLMVASGAFWNYSRYATTFAQNIAAAPESETHGEKTEACTEKWLTDVRALRSWPGKPDQCYLHDFHATDRPAACYDVKKPSIAVWGDSHAAALYLGFNKLAEINNWGIIEVSAAGCPPLLNLSTANMSWRNNCNEINQTVLKKLAKAKPDVIVLNAAWHTSDLCKIGFDCLVNISMEELAVLLDNTLKSIKHELPNSKITVIGPTPNWQISPEQVAYLNSLKTNIKPPPIMQKATQLTAIDDILKNTSQVNEATFISANAALCDDTGCVSRVSGNEPDYIACDYGHFTKSGSEYFVNRIKNDVSTVHMKLHINKLLGE